MGDNKAKTLYTREYYKSFDHYKASKDKSLAWLLKRFYSGNSLKKNAVILDIGCGRGELISRLGLGGWNVYGFDFSESALSVAKETIRQLPDDKTKDIHLLCADSAFIPFKDKSIDFIFSSELFEHLNDAELKCLIREIYRVLKDNGRFIILTSPNKTYADMGYRYWIRPVNIILSPLTRIIFKKALITSSHYSDPTHINLHSVKSLRMLFKDSGFRTRIYTRWFLPDDFKGYIYKIISQLWPVTLFAPMRNLFCPYLWAEGEKE
jgi:ubiquinone/menaquinone biosynthesis C-methylase UbiE